MAVLGALGAILGGLGAVLGTLATILRGLGALLGALGAILSGLGVLLAALGAILRGLGRLLGRSWADFGRSKIEPKIDPKIDTKSSRIRIGQKRSGATLVMVSEPEEAQANSGQAAPKNYLTGYPRDSFLCKIVS